MNLLITGRVSQLNRSCCKFKLQIKYTVTSSPTSFSKNIYTVCILYLPTLPQNTRDIFLEAVFKKISSLNGTPAIVKPCDFITSNRVRRKNACSNLLLSIQCLLSKKALCSTLESLQNDFTSLE